MAVAILAVADRAERRGLVITRTTRHVSCRHRADSGSTRPVIGRCVRRVGGASVAVSGEDFWV